MTSRFRFSLAATVIIALSACAVPANINGLPGGVLSGIRATSNQVVLAMGEEKDLITLLRGPGDSIPSQPLAWTSSNEAVARVEGPTGRVKAVGKGTAVLTASSTTDPNLRVVLEISVVEKHSVSTIRVEPSRPFLVIGEKAAFTAQVNMADGQINGNVAWSSSDDTIATVNPTTGEVSALKEGKVTILASFTLEPRYKGVAEVTIVKDKSMIPASPSPAPIIFGPSATPLPSPSPSQPVIVEASSPTPRPTASVGTGNSNSTIPVISNGSTGAWPPSKFLYVSQEFGYGVSFSLVNIDTIFAVNGTTLYRTTNRGNTWTTVENVGTQNLFTSSWVDANNGWVGGANGTILKVEIVDGQATFKVQDSKTASQISSLYFLNASEGYAAAGGQIFKTADGGTTWTAGAKLTSYAADGAFRSDGLSGIVYHAPYFGQIYRLGDGGFSPISIGTDNQFSIVSSVPNSGVACIKDYDTQNWWVTTDWQNFNKVGTTLTTRTQILRNANISAMSASSATNLIAYCSSSSSNTNGAGWMSSEDGGRTWTDPIDLGLSPSGMWAYGPNKIWATGSGRWLYRAGF